MVADGVYEMLFNVCMVQGKYCQQFLVLGGGRVSSALGQMLAPVPLPGWDSCCTSPTSAMKGFLGALACSVSPVPALCYSKCCEEWGSLEAQEGLWLPTRLLTWGEAASGLGAAGGPWSRIQPCPRALVLPHGVWPCQQCPGERNGS